MTIDELKVYLENAIAALGGATEEMKAKAEAFSFVLSLINNRSPVLRLSSEEEDEVEIILDRSTNECKQAVLLYMLKDRAWDRKTEDDKYLPDMVIPIYKEEEEIEIIKEWFYNQKR